MLITGRKEIIAEFKALVSSFPEKMGSMQNKLAKHKESAADIHSLRADVESLTDILNRKVKFNALNFIHSIFFSSLFLVGEFPHIHMSLCVCITIRLRS